MANETGPRSGSEEAGADTADGNGDEGDGGDAGNKLQTQLPGIEVTTQLADGDLDELEAVHRRQLEWALDHAEEAKEATRL